MVGRVAAPHPRPGQPRSSVLSCYFRGGRKFNIPPWYRFFIWLSYLGSDALVIYSLATLFNRQKKLQYSSTYGSRDLEVFWAPILLAHLGGRDFITAYNIEDNELWRRHILTEISQVVVAIYVFWKSWSVSADKNLLNSAILLFIPGVMKCFEKPWALQSASFSSLISSSDHVERTTTTNREEELKAYVQKARVLVQQNNPPPVLGDDDKQKFLKKLSMPDRLFVDFAYPYHLRLANLESFWVLDDTTAHQALEVGLSKIFDILYTRAKMTDDYDNDNMRFCGGLTLLVSWSFSIAAIVLFHRSDKREYSSSDVTITFVLLYCTFVLHAISFMTLGLVSDKWPNMVAQRSLIGCFARDKRNNKLMSFVEFLGCKGLLDQYWGSKPCCSSKEISKLVRENVKYGWTNYITDAESYMKFIDNWGKLTLERKVLERSLGWSLEKPFDESVLLWHVATDFCLHLKGSEHEFAGRCREISNYMMHLLLANPEMLMAGSRRNLFTAAYCELKAILQGEDELQLAEEQSLALKIINKAKCKEGFIHDALLLAEGLMGLSADKMWEVIKDVWIEMLCFSAARSRGYLHAKCLGSGGEYLLHLASTGSRRHGDIPGEAAKVAAKLSNERRVTEEAAGGPSSEAQVVVSR